MIKAGGGSIIKVTSHLSLIGSVKPAYAACKGGIITFTKTLAAQYVQYGIRASAIGPGSVRTERTIARYDNKSDKPVVKPAISARARETIQKLYPFSKGEPDDIAAIGVFLASDESRMITGTTIAADGRRWSYLKVSAEE
jgi:NAD(P)-dependent dehydrogenase (short-subunit alcohol dehydrogenase family)